MRYSSLLTRQLAVFSILFSVALAFSVALGSPTSASASASASASTSVSVLTTVATNQPTCLGVGASVIPALGVGPNPGAAEDLGFDSSSDSTDGSYDGASTSRRGLKSGQMNDLLYERQYDSSDASDGSMGASDGSTDASDGSTGASTPAPLAGTPIQIPPNTTYCGWLGGTGMQSDMLLFNNPGTYQLTWQNVTGDGRKYSPALCPIQRCPYPCHGCFLAQSWENRPVTSVRVIGSERTV